MRSRLAPTGVSRPCVRHPPWRLPRRVDDQGALRFTARGSLRRAVVRSGGRLVPTGCAIDRASDVPVAPSPRAGSRISPRCQAAIRRRRGRLFDAPVKATPLPRPETPSIERSFFLLLEDRRPRTAPAWLAPDERACAGPGFAARIPPPPRLVTVGMALCFGQERLPRPGPRSRPRLRGWRFSGPARPFDFCNDFSVRRTDTFRPSAILARRGGLPRQRLPRVCLVLAHLPRAAPFEATHATTLQRATRSLRRPGLRPDPSGPNSPKPTAPAFCRADAMT